MSNKYGDMKYHFGPQITKIVELQNKANAIQKDIVNVLAEADELAVQLKDAAGERFTYDNVPFMFSHRANGYGIAGNRYWLFRDDSFKVLRDG